MMNIKKNLKVKNIKKYETKESKVKNTSMIPNKIHDSHDR
jgi:hypothetical protein